MMRKVSYLLKGVPGRVWHDLTDDEVLSLLNESREGGPVGDR
jgi:hypothetical protein